ncbi:MAG: hypothetical protein ABWX93_08065 [Pseudoxanthomonas sp.]
MKITQQDQHHVHQRRDVHFGNGGITDASGESHGALLESVVDSTLRRLARHRKR